MSCLTEAAKLTFKANDLGAGCVAALFVQDACASRPKCLYFSSRTLVHLVEWSFELSFLSMPIKNPQPMAEGLVFGAPGEIRTPDQVVRSHLLYPAELRVRRLLNRDYT